VRRKRVVVARVLGEGWFGKGPVGAKALGVGDCPREGQRKGEESETWRLGQQMGGTGSQVEEGKAWRLSSWSSWPGAAC
jgi:hypothetical protein